MILAEKIMQLRKKNGWSQEELAEQMNVSRQSVSKWESAQSIPDLNKILTMSRLFGVSTDYLLKDEMEEHTEQEAQMETEQPLDQEVHFVSIEEANRFLEAKEITAPRVALGSALCILSPIPLFLLGALSEMTNENGVSRWISENVAAGIGLLTLALIITAAVALFLSCRTYTADFDYLDKEPIETAYGVSGMVQELKLQYRDRYSLNNMIGVCLCILSTVPLFLALWFCNAYPQEDLIMCIGLCLMLVVISVAVSRFILVGIIWESYQKLLQEGDYSRKQKSQSNFNQLYWGLITAVYLLYSFYSGNWHTSWLIWIIASPLRKLLVIVLKL